MFLDFSLKDDSKEKSRQLKNVVEFAYAIDSKQNPMVQIADLVILVARRFHEMAHPEFGKNWPEDICKKYASLFALIDSRAKIRSRTTIKDLARGIELNRELGSMSEEDVAAAFLFPPRSWKKKLSVG